MFLHFDIIIFTFFTFMCHFSPNEERLAFLNVMLFTDFFKKPDFLQWNPSSFDRYQVVLLKI